MAKVNFIDWWTANVHKLESIANFWLLPRKLKMILRALIAGVTAALASVVEDVVSADASAPVMSASLDAPETRRTALGNNIRTRQRQLTLGQILIEDPNA